MTANLLLLSLFVLGSGGTSTAACRPEDFSHAKRIYAPLPYIRDAAPTCKHIGVPALRLRIDEKGGIDEARFLKSSGCKLADEKLRACLVYWRYEPATCAGEPVAEVMTVTINWHLEERQVQDPCRPDEPGEPTEDSDPWKPRQRFR